MTWSCSLSYLGSSEYYSKLIAWVSKYIYHPYGLESTWLLLVNQAYMYSFIELCALSHIDSSIGSRLHSKLHLWWDGCSLNVLQFFKFTALQVNVCAKYSSMSSSSSSVFKLRSSSLSYHQFESPPDHQVRQFFKLKS